MKLIIDIDKELKSAIYRCGLFLNPTEKVSLIDAINNGTHIPDNATNGDMMRLVFKDFMYVPWKEWLMIDLSWWNAPYQKGEKDADSN